MRFLVNFPKLLRAPVGNCFWCFLMTGLLKFRDECYNCFSYTFLEEDKVMKYWYKSFSNRYAKICSSKYNWTSHLWKLSPCVLWYSSQKNFFPFIVLVSKNLTPSFPINVDSLDVILTWIHETIRRKYGKQFSKSFQSSSSYRKWNFSLKNL